MEKFCVGYGEGGVVIEIVEQGYQLWYGGYLYFFGQDGVNDVIDDYVVDDDFVGYDIVVQQGYYIGYVYIGGGQQVVLYGGFWFGQIFDVQDEEYG